jgi:hypothetical protein
MKTLLFRLYIEEIYNKHIQVEICMYALFDFEDMIVFINLLASQYCFFYESFYLWACLN